jgi:arginine kinase
MEYPNFTNEYRSLMAKHLTKNVFTQLENISSENGFSLKDAINSGLLNPDSNIGAYAGDLESYFCFSPLFDPIIHQYHGTQNNQLHSTNLNPAEIDSVNPDPDNNYIVSTRIRVGRNLADMPLGPSISKTLRDEVETKIVSALTQLSGSLSGDYYPLVGMQPSIQNRLIEDHFLFKAGDKYLEAAGLNRDWPAGRGIYHNDQKTFLVWVNEEDQLRIISMQAGGNIQQVFQRLTLALSELECHLDFLFSPYLGYISSCPTNLGTSMRASVHIKLPNLGRKLPEFNTITKLHHLQIRGVHGEHSKSEGDIYDVSNCRRLGVTEVQCVQDLYNGVVALIAKEKELAEP